MPPSCPQGGGVGPGQGTDLVQGRKHNVGRSRRRDQPALAQQPERGGEFQLAGRILGFARPGKPLQYETRLSPGGLEHRAIPRQGQSGRDAKGVAMSPEPLLARPIPGGCDRHSSCDWRPHAPYGQCAGAPAISYRPQPPDRQTLPPVSIYSEAGRNRAQSPNKLIRKGGSMRFQSPRRWGEAGLARWTPSDSKRGTSTIPADADGLGPVSETGSSGPQIGTFTRQNFSSEEAHEHHVRYLDGLTTSRR